MISGKTLKDFVRTTPKLSAQTTNPHSRAMYDDRGIDAVVAVIELWNSVREGVTSYATYLLLLYDTGVLLVVCHT